MARMTWTDHALEALRKEGPMGELAVQAFSNFEDTIRGERRKAENAVKERDVALVALEKAEKQIRDLQRVIDRLKREKNALACVGAVLSL